MRSIVIAAVIAAGFGLAGATPSLAAPASSGLGELSTLAKSDSQIEQARWRRHCRHWRHSRRSCWRRCWPGLAVSEP